MSSFNAATTKASWDERSAKNLTGALLRGRCGRYDVIALMLIKKDNAFEVAMDQVLIDVFSSLAKKYQCSVDTILESPELREEYLARTRHVLGDLPERDLLHGLVSLRKRSKLPRTRDLLRIVAD